MLPYNTHNLSISKNYKTSAIWLSYSLEYSVWDVFRLHTIQLHYDAK